MKTALLIGLSAIVITVSLVVIAGEKIWEAGWIYGSSDMCYDRDQAEGLARTDAQNKAYDGCRQVEGCYYHDIQHGTMKCEECTNDPPQYRCEVESKFWCKCHTPDE